MPDTEKLKDMLDKLVNGKPEMAQVDFHDYLRAKLSGVLGGKTGEQTQEPNADVTTKE
jgi:hypothetical protein